MAGAARIGSLHVMLGLDSAEFTNGMKKASNGLDKFTKAAKIGFAAVAVAATAAGAALTVAVKGSIDRADDLSKTAQRIGTTTEALSRLEWAAKLSDVSLEQLSTGMQRLSRNMLDVSQGRGAQAATAFKALGIAVTDAEGRLRSSDAVFADLADRLSRMPDSAEKTALAMSLLGRAGADMIPLLNSGKQGLADMAAESDRLGNTISTTTGKAAEQFNDTLTRLQAVFAGVANKIAAGVLPQLNALAGKLADPAFADAAMGLAQGIVGAINMVIDAISAARSKLAEFGELLEWLSTHDWFTGKIDPDKMAARERGALGEIRGQLGRGEREAPDAAFMESIFGKGAGEVSASAQTVADAFVPVYENVGAASKAATELNKVMAEGKAVFTATRTPAEAYGIELERLNRLLQQGAIDQDTYNRAVVQAQDAFRDAEVSGNQLASTLSSGLANMFSSIVDGSKDAVSAIGDLLKSLGQMLIHKGFEALIGGMFGGGGGFGSILGGLFGGGGGLKLGFNGIPGFDGGGYTGQGPRVGGLDGKGGFMAMLHPNETVLDHSRGQGAGEAIVINISGSRLDAAEIAREVRKVLPDVYERYQRNPLRRS